MRGAVAALGRTTRASLGFCRHERALGGIVRTSQLVECGSRCRRGDHIAYAKEKQGGQAEPVQSSRCRQGNPMWGDDLVTIAEGQAGVQQNEQARGHRNAFSVENPA